MKRSTPIRLTPMAIVVALALGALFASAQSASALSYNGCNNTAAPTISPHGINKYISGNVTIKVGIKCSSSRTVKVQGRIENVYCRQLVSVVPICNTTYYAPVSLSGTWSAGQTRTPTIWWPCQNALSTGDDTFYFMGGDYPQFRWSTDGGSHYSSWVGTDYLHALSFWECN